MAPNGKVYDLGVYVLVVDEYEMSEVKPTVEGRKEFLHVQPRALSEIVANMRQTGREAYADLLMAAVVEAVVESRVHAGIMSNSEVVESEAECGAEDKATRGGSLAGEGSAGRPAGERSKGRPEGEGSLRSVPWGERDSEDEELSAAPKVGTVDVTVSGTPEELERGKGVVWVECAHGAVPVRGDAKEVHPPPRQEGDHKRCTRWKCVRWATKWYWTEAVRWEDG